MADATGFAEFFGAVSIARGPWGHHGTLLGGILSMPLGRRDIFVLPADATESDVEILRGKGVEWVVWDVVGAGDPPAAIARAAGRRHEFHPAHDVHFLLLFLKPD